MHCMHSMFSNTTTPTPNKTKEVNLQFFYNDPHPNKIFNSDMSRGIIK